VLVTAGAAAAATLETAPMTEVRFMTLDPGHFHAALVLKEMYPGVAPRVDVFAPLGPDVVDHLARVSRFNLRRDKPTAWQMEAHTGPDFLARMVAEKPGNVVVLSGRNRGKIGRVQASLDAGLHVLVDKPWILEATDFPALEKALATADQKGLVAFDIMTERFEVTNQLQRELVGDPAVFGKIVPGTPQEPGVYMESVHNLMKVVAGAPNIRPTWFFDSDEQGEGLNDIGTHLVDLVQWSLFPDQALDYKKDAKVLAAQRWPTNIPRADFKRVTNADFPESFAPRVKNDALEYFCNTLVNYSLRGVNVKLNVIWDWEAPAGAGDTHYAVYRGSLARVEVRQGAADKYRPELYVVPNAAADKTKVRSAIDAKVTALQARYAGIGVEDRGTELHVTIPDALRVSHEEHFGQVTRLFLGYLKDRGQMPAWEKPNLLSKYFVTTEGARMARLGPAQVAPRIAPR
jgi:predicted dehydrogenase